MSRIKDSLNVLLILFAILIVIVGIRYVQRQNPVQGHSQTTSEIYFPETDIHAMALQDSILWVGGKDGLKRFDLNRRKELPITGGMSQIRFVRGLAVDSCGQIFVGHHKGLSRYEEDQIITLNTTNGLPDNRVNTVYLDRNNILWVGTWSGAARLVNGKWEVISVNEGLLHPMVNVIYQDYSGGYWFGSYVAPRGGLCWLKDGKWSYWTKDDGLPHPNITAITGNETSIWIGTGLYNRGGAVEFGQIDKSTGWEISRVHTKKDGLNGEKVRSLHLDAMNCLWLGFEYDGINLLSANDLQNFGLKEGLSHVEVKCFLERENGIWIGTRQGLTYTKLPLND